MLISRMTDITVLERPSEPTKINLIRVIFAGTVQVGSNTLSLFSRESQVAGESGGTLQLEAKSNRFPFEVKIPAESSELPTSMKLGEKNDDVAVSVRYTITASLHRPFTLQALAPTDVRDISVVEPIDVSLSQYDRPVPTKKEDGKVVLGGMSLAISVPKAAYVRGDLMPVMITVQGDHPFAKKHAIRMALVRRIYFCGKGRRELVKWENATKSVDFDVDLALDNDFTQEIPAKIYLPPSLAPTTGSSGRILRVEYSIRVSFDTNDAESGTKEWKKSFELSKDLPIIIGTTPRANFSIDDDEEEEEMVDGTCLEDGITADGEDNDITSAVKIEDIKLDEKCEEEHQSAETTTPPVEKSTKNTTDGSPDESDERLHLPEDLTQSPVKNSDDPKPHICQHMDGDHYDTATARSHETNIGDSGSPFASQNPCDSAQLPSSPSLASCWDPNGAATATAYKPVTPEGGGFQMPEPIHEPYHAAAIPDHITRMLTPYPDTYPAPRSPSPTFVQMPSSPSFPQHPPSPRPHYDYQHPQSSPSPTFVPMPSAPNFPRHSPSPPPRTTTPSPVLFHPMPTAMNEPWKYNSASPVRNSSSPEQWKMSTTAHHHRQHTPYPEPTPSQQPYWNQ
ncbi:hypothetical protein BX666DRAFT_897141 [Dichotomocladium elegans]|nr:hypothetical protein BX666DRAFT_897141 [Dichotomocladium elegans]